MTAATNDKFQIGDRVLHPAKPEWGAGTIANASGALHEGAPCQRLSIRFDRAGLKTISTAFVNLRRAAGSPASFPEPKPDPKPEPAFSPRGSAAPATRGAFSGSGTPDPLGPPAANGMPTDPREARKLMAAIPEDAVDPFQGPASRLRATLSLYRFQPTGGSLIDWAAAQSGLADPLSHFARHELEEYFSDFRRNLDKALAKAVADASQVDPAELRSIAQSAPPEAQRALQSLHRRR
ncbi:MAG: DUF3553 domain-containing protein [Phycisphaerales bacterium]|nr:DUF3553 domain-containing protein [Planctomycetota bacterium]MCH8508828.1 DUF3553 domain-containing protein [Phycisphaerales bacterium]